MISASDWPRVASTLFRTFGVRGGALRASHELRARAGLFRAATRHSAAGGAFDGAHPFRVDAAALRAATDEEQAVARADRVAGGAFQAFRSDWRRLPAQPADWLRQPHTGKTAAADAPWWHVVLLDRGFGDIKDLWEPARFPWVYDLVRAYLITGDDRYARAFREAFLSWHASSPAFRGPHWSCGQETAIRAVALLYAEANLADAPSMRGEPMRLVRQVLAAAGERIADAIAYAVSQRNNHSLSEAAGLVALGARFRGQHPEAEGWLARGQRVLEREVRAQFARDGWYIQHSFTYLRVALDQCVVAERVLRSVRRTLSREAVDRLRASVELVLPLVDGETGLLPNHGANDGAFVHPVTLAEYRDFRPVLTAACATWGLPLPADVPADAETLAWLGAAPPAPGPRRGDGVWSGPSGWAAVRAGETTVFLRAGRYTARPAHLDPLQLDVRFGGREAVVDAGSYAYNGPPPWRNGLTAAAVHNGPVVDGREPGVRGPRFLWYLWPAADLLRAAWKDGEAHLVAEVPGQARREVRVRPGLVTVRDSALAPDAGELRVRWLLHPSADPACVATTPAGQVREPEPGGTAGWFSPAYGTRVRTRWVEAAASPAAGEREIVTVIRDLPRLPGLYTVIVTSGNAGEG